MKTVYVDMDGVLCDFNSRFTSLFGNVPEEAREKKETTFSKYWNTFVVSRQFATLEKLDGADELITYLNSLKTIRVAILGSTGGFNHHNSVMLQKFEWLDKHNINWPACFVPGKKYKAGYATKDSFLIDDTNINITNFIDAGGSAVLHTNATDSIKSVKEWLL